MAATSSSRRWRLSSSGAPVPRDIDVDVDASGHFALGRPLLVDTDTDFQFVSRCQAVLSCDVAGCLLLRSEGKKNPTGVLPRDTITWLWLHSGETRALSSGDLIALDERLTPGTVFTIVSAIPALRRNPPAAWEQLQPLSAFTWNEPPPADATLVAMPIEHTDFQPMPSQTLHFPDGLAKVARTTFTPFMTGLRHPPLAPARIEVLDVGGPRGRVTILRNLDGAGGLRFARALQDAFGLDVLEGRGTQNQCSPALGFKCHTYGDSHCRVWPLGTGEQCTASRQDDGGAGGFYQWVEPLFEQAAACAQLDTRKERFPTGSVQLLSYRSRGSSWLGANGGVPYGSGPPPGTHPDDPSATMHMHVDNDKRAGLVCIVNVGDSADMAFDLGRHCRRLLRRPGTGSVCVNPGEYQDKNLIPDLDWSCSGRCTSCQQITVHSGDVVLFDGSVSSKGANDPDGVAHGVLGTHAGTAPAALPAWAKGRRLSMQYRQLDGTVKVRPQQYGCAAQPAPAPLAQPAVQPAASSMGGKRLNRHGSPWDSDDDDEEAAPPPKVSREESDHLRLCIPWALPPLSRGWFRCKRSFIAVRGPVSYSGTQPVEQVPFNATMTYDYVSEARTSELLEMLERVSVVPFVDGTVEAPATVPNQFGGMRSSTSPSRMAFAADSGLTYRYGKVRYVTRPTVWMGDVPGRPREEERLCALLRTMAAELTERELRGTGLEFNYVLVQKYDGPESCLSWHRDASEAKGSTTAGQVYGTPVASVSLGADRVFAFTPDAYKDGQPQYGIRLTHRCLVVMDASCNKGVQEGGFAHALLCGSASDGGGARYNLTFRVMQVES